MTLFYIVLTMYSLLNIVLAFIFLAINTPVSVITTYLILTLGIVLTFLGVIFYE